MTDTHALGSFTVIIVLFSIVLAILWFILPFAIFGTKSKLDQLIHEAKKTNHALLITSQELVILRTKFESYTQVPRNQGPLVESGGSLAAAAPSASPEAKSIADATRPNATCPRTDCTAPLRHDDPMCWKCGADFTNPQGWKPVRST